MASSRLSSRSRQDQGFKWARISIVILSTIGVIDTGSITLSRWGIIGSLSCPGSFGGCEKVLNSSWGTIFANSNFSIPLSFLGLFSYFLIVVLSIAPYIPLFSENKNKVASRTWWFLFFLSGSMSVFSIILMGIMIFKIQSICLFCIFSAVISILIFLLTLKGGNWNDPGDLIFKGSITFLIVTLLSLIWASAVNPEKKEKNLLSSNSAPLVKRNSSLSAIALAEHLSEEGAVMYFAYWCKYCALQKELFGKEAVSKLNLVECAEDGKNSQSNLCKEKGIDSYPSWEINGEITSGALPLEELANISGYNGTRDFR